MPTPLDLRWTHLECGKCTTRDGTYLPCPAAHPAGLNRVGLSNVFGLFRTVKVTYLERLTTALQNMDQLVTGSSFSIAR